jgi:hypothetical protein
MDDNTPICYWKGYAKDFTNPNAELKWVEMTNDPSVGKITEANMAGIISFKLCIVERQQIKAVNFVQDFSMYWPLNLPRSLHVKRAIVNIY